MSLRPNIPTHPYRANRLVTAPAAEPVTATELRAHVKQTATEMPDATANLLIADARQEIEDQTGLAMITQTWMLTLDRWPGYAEPWWDGVRQGAIGELRGTPGFVTMPRYPLQSVSDVDTYDTAGSATAAVVATVFDVDASQAPGRLSLASGQVWPVATRPTNGVEITYIAGYGDAASDVPGPIKRAVRQMAGYMDAHRGDGCDVKSAYRDSGAAGILASYAVLAI